MPKTRLPDLQGSGRAGICLGLWNSSGARDRLWVGDAAYDVLRLDRVDGSTVQTNMLRCTRSPHC
jgi:hypothetical protein